MSISRNLLRIFVVATVLPALMSCSAEQDALTPVTESRGVISNSQQQALEAANTVEQTLLDAAAQREKELQERLQR